MQYLTERDEDQQTPAQEKQSLLQTVFRNGKVLRETTLDEMRERGTKYTAV
jgi:hypothetical protein